MLIEVCTAERVVWAHIVGCVSPNTLTFEAIVLLGGCWDAMFLYLLAFYPTAFERKQVLFVASFIQQTSCFCWKSPRDISAHWPWDKRSAKWTHSTEGRCSIYIFNYIYDKCKWLNLWIVIVSDTMFMYVYVVPETLLSVCEQREGAGG